MATKAKKRGRPAKRPKKAWLPDMEPPSHKDIDGAAEHYVDQRDERCALSKLEAEAHTNLMEKMKEHDLTTYETPDGLIVQALSKTKCRVKRKKDHESNGEANGDTL